MDDFALVPFANRECSFSGAGRHKGPVPAGEYWPVSTLLGLICYGEVVSSDLDRYVSTRFVERQNLSLRMGSRRFTRLTMALARSSTTTSQPSRCTSLTTIFASEGAGGGGQGLGGSCGSDPDPSGRRRKLTVIQGRK